MTARLKSKALEKGESGNPWLVSEFLATADDICNGGNRAWKPRNKEFIQVSLSNIIPTPPGFECQLKDEFHISEFLR